MAQERNIACNILYMNSYRVFHLIDTDAPLCYNPRAITFRDLCKSQPTASKLFVLSRYFEPC